MWATLSRFDRPIGFDGLMRISLSTMHNFCEEEDALETDLSKMMFLEEKLFPVIRKRTDNKKET